MKPFLFRHKWFFLLAAALGALLFAMVSVSYYSWRKNLAVRGGYFDTSEAAMKPLAGFGNRYFRFGASFSVMSWDGSHVGYSPGLPPGGVIAHNLELARNNSPIMEVSVGFSSVEYTLVIPTP
jgi:hypothetical protein